MPLCSRVVLCRCRVEEHLPKVTVPVPVMVRLSTRSPWRGLSKWAPRTERALIDVICTAASTSDEACLEAMKSFFKAVSQEQHVPHLAGMACPQAKEALLLQCRLEVGLDELKCACGPGGSLRREHARAVSLPRPRARPPHASRDARQGGGILKRLLAVLKATFDDDDD